MSPDDLVDEAAHHQRIRDAMAQMRAATQDRLDFAQADYMEGRSNRRPGDARPDHHYAFAVSTQGAQRLEALAEKNLPLFFGRVWLDTEEDYHLGRQHVRDPADRSVPLVVDWRAPLAERFYRAGPADRRGVERRRRFGFQGDTLVGLEDEDLAHGVPGTGGTSVGRGEGPSILESEIERPRTGPMRDIVATIQPEQDELIRRDDTTTICVQGAPGTGKTAVGLHRAAWLLYTYPRRLSASGMLVVGPNENFLSYISGVLPTLGESAVSQTTLQGLLGTSATAPAEAPAVTALKHDARMVDVLARAVWSQVSEPEGDQVVSHGGLSLDLSAEHLAGLTARVRADARGWTAGRKSLEQAVVHALLARAEDLTGRPKDGPWTQALRRSADLRALVDTIWPRLTAKQVLRRLFQDQDFRAAACAGQLDVDEQGLLARRGALRPTVADLLLLDEIDAHLRLRSADQTWGHVVVDEAQDLSPLECRAVARRCPSGSMTVLGDLAQGTTPWAARSWTEQMHHLDRPECEHTELTTGYRVPGVVLEVANRLLPHLQVDVPPATSLRRDGTYEARQDPDLLAGAVLAAKEALGTDGMVGVIAAEDHLASLAEALPTDERLELVGAASAKGLEFDHVVVVEPAAVVEQAGAHVTGFRHLYVALTRAVSTLRVVHARPLPSPLQGP